MSTKSVAWAKGNLMIPFAELGSTGRKAGLKGVQSGVGAGALRCELPIKASGGNVRQRVWSSRKKLRTL